MKQQNHYAPFDFERYYHVFNRSNNREPLFLSDSNYQHFIKLFDKYLSSYVNIYPYCLLPNHFHFMVQVKAKEEMDPTNVDDNSVNEIITGQFRKLFIAYTMAFNKQHDRNGNLFHRRFKRILVDSDAYFSQLTYYIHLNPVKHQLTNDFGNYKWSSYKKIIHPVSTKLKKQEILDWFGGKERFELYHKDQANFYISDNIIAED